MGVRPIVPEVLVGVAFSDELTNLEIIERNAKNHCRDDEIASPSSAVLKSTVGGGAIWLCRDSAFKSYIRQAQLPPKYFEKKI
jgi:hypothetical protein